MATEYSPGGFTNYVPWIINKVTDYLRGDVAVKGGITPILKTAHLAEAFGMNYEVHHGGNSLNNWANPHVILSIRNTTYFEGSVADRGAEIWHHRRSLSPTRTVSFPRRPRRAWALKIDFDLIQAKTVDVLVMSAALPQIISEGMAMRANKN